VALFKCSDKFHAWVIGGWNNTRSEVLRIRETMTPHKVEPEKWYEIKVSVVGDTVSGIIDGTKVWTVPREIFEKSDSQEEFLPGVGIGVWSTLCKFGDIQIRER